MITTSTSALAVGVNTMSFMWRASAREALETLARRGYRRFELMATPAHFDPMMDYAQAKAFAEFLADAGLVVETINMPSLDQNLASAVGEMRDYTVKLFQRLISIAETIGARGIITVTGRVNPLIQPDRAQLEAWFGDAFARIERSAREAGVCLMLENIPMGVYPDAVGLLRFAEQFDTASVSICYDIANAHFIREDAAAGLRTVAARLDIVHLSDTKHDAWRHDPVGEGSCDFARFAEALRTIGYAKTSMLEIVADPPVEHIVESNHKLAQWGWEAPVDRSPD